MKKSTNGLAAFLRDSRMAKGWSQGEAATRTGIAQSQLSQYEHGNISPTLHSLDKLCRAYGKLLAEAGHAMDVAADSQN